jgi:hypothetical protein
LGKGVEIYFVVSLFLFSRKVLIPGYIKIDIKF